MNFRSTFYIFVVLLIAVIIYFLSKGLNNSPQNLSSISVNDSLNALNSSIADENVPGQNLKPDSGTTVKHDEAVEDKAKKDNIKLIVYYFHATARCKECINIENFTKEIVETEFTKEKKSVKMIFRPLNIEDSVNEHYINDFNLDVSTVILSKLINNKQVGWKNLEHVWKYADDKPLFFKYVKDGIKDFLSKKEEI